MSLFQYFVQNFVIRFQILLLLRHHMQKEGLFVLMSYVVCVPFRKFSVDVDVERVEKTARAVLTYYFINSLLIHFLVQSYFYFTLFVCLSLLLLKFSGYGSLVYVIHRTVCVH
jgi:hypothetical protein